jgi:hypothetical protein
MADYDRDVKTGLPIGVRELNRNGAREDLRVKPGSETFYCLLGGAEPCSPKVIKAPFSDAVLGNIRNLAQGVGHLIIGVVERRYALIKHASEFMGLKHS